MMKGRPHLKRRWYDKHQKLYQAVTLLGTFPKTIQPIIGEGASLIAERRFHAHELMASFRSLGSEKVLGLYKSKNKRRPTDQIAQVHKAINYMYILPDENRFFMAGHVLELVHVVYGYFNVCKEFKAAPASGHIQRLSDTYVDHGYQRALELNDRYKVEFNRVYGDRVQGDALHHEIHNERITGIRLEDDDEE